MRNLRRLTESQWLDDDDFADIPQETGVAFQGEWRPGTSWAGITILICWLDDEQGWECEARYHEPAPTGESCGSWSVVIVVQHTRALEAAHRASAAIHAAATFMHRQH